VGLIKIGATARQREKASTETLEPPTPPPS
jgi:hypothetical protein